MAVNRVDGHHEGHPSHQRELAKHVQGVEAEGLCEVGPETGEHEVCGQDIALDL
jgi:hypothetical protein